MRDYTSIMNLSYFRVSHSSHAWISRNFCCSPKMQGTGGNGTGVRPLFGGALTAVIPHSASDISELREIPDNQEVFVHKQTDQSLMVDLLEYQAHVQDIEAARYHFEDLAGSNEASSLESSEVVHVEPLTKSQLSLHECSCAFFLTGTQRVSKFNEEAKNTVNIHLGLFRLPQFSTDILVTFNDPIRISPLSSSAAEDGVVIAAPWTSQDFLQLLQSLRLLDPGVFG
ncbi:hypothetical protein SKAU_G00329030 [Synaphobranchus kaupii]|uniref:Ran guanine nucleotide release factor n=1 Tax=Synaphobranchus kaupii TaxID=118154 RepID=A0A9Q1IJL2_SYNKA|nr:hypothetical protein SKAU_G00329030 [Synaphobranchus kaupii]